MGDKSPKDKQKHKKQQEVAKINDHKKRQENAQKQHRDNGGQEDKKAS